VLRDLREKEHFDTLSPEWVTLRGELNGKKQEEGKGIGH
jgi:hypothetical protein